MSRNRQFYDWAKKRSRSVGSRGRSSRKGNIGVSFHTFNKGDRFSRQTSRAKRVYSGKGRPPSKLTFQEGVRSNRVRYTRKGLTPEQRNAVRKRSLLPRGKRASVGTTGKSSTPINITYKSQRGIINTGRVTANFRFNNTIKVGAVLSAGGLGITYAAHRQRRKS